MINFKDIYKILTLHRRKYLRDHLIGFRGPGTSRLDGLLPCLCPIDWGKSISCLNDVTYEGLRLLAWITHLRLAVFIVWQSVLIFIFLNVIAPLLALLFIFSFVFTLACHDSSLSVSMS